MSPPKPPIGISNFQEVIEDGYFYVDKSLLIQEVLDQAAKVMLVPRPRRFGKTLNMNMLKAFFEKAEPSHTALFHDLAIQQIPDCMKHQGQYPVIYLTFKDTRASTWNECYEKIVEVLANECDRHLENYSRWETAPISPNQKKKLERLASQDASSSEFQNALLTLSRNLQKLSGKPVVLLIDEYDVPIQNAFHHGYFDEAVGFIRNLLGGGLKDNPHLYKAVLTGILRVAKESIFSGLNNVKVFSILKTPFADKFGLTEEEVKKALEQFDLHQNLEEVEQWYNGYGIGNHQIYNPWSVINYLDEKELGPYWINTSDNQIISDLMKGGDAELQIDLTSLLSRESIEIPLNDHVAYSDIRKGREEVWNFLTFTGYLSVENVSGTPGKLRYDVKIPNKEVLSFFEGTLLQWLDKFSLSSNLNRMLDFLMQADIPHFGEELKKMVDRVMSYHDIGAKEPEKTYHMFVLGMLMHLEKQYHIDSNRESGMGRYDIMLLPKAKTGKGIILEFKQVTKASQAEDELESALTQIQNKDYVQRLRSAGFHDNLGIGLVFCGKQVWWKHCSLSN